jgi:hypothetical protein
VRVLLRAYGLRTLANGDEAFRGGGPVNARLLSQSIGWLAAAGALVGLLWGVVLVLSGDSTDGPVNTIEFVSASLVLFGMAGAVFGVVIGIPLALVIRRPRGHVDEAPKAAAAWTNDED